MRITCWIPTATNTHSEYAILIAFPLQQLFHERASLLRYTHIACPVLTNITLCEVKCNQLINRPIKRLTIPHHTERSVTISIEQSSYLLMYLFIL